MENKDTNKFLREVARILVERHKRNFSEVIIVVPTLRARLFLLRHIQKQLGETFWSPRFFVLPEFVEWLSGSFIASGQDLMLGLYKVYKDSTDSPESFVDFTKWSSIALKDFHDIDASLADASKVFSDLRNIKEIEGWSFNLGHLSQSQHDYMKFWADLGMLYQNFSEWQLGAGKWSYQKLIRHILDQPDASLSILKQDFIYFVGIASFSTAEQKLIGKLKARNPLDVYWDVDHYYLKDDLNEAGYYARKFGIAADTKFISDKLSASEKRIVEHESETSVSQVMTVTDILEKFTRDELNETCIVLTDDAMLEPLLSTLPDMPVPVNIAMGIALRNSSGMRWFLALLGIRSKLNWRGIYHQDFSRLLQLTSDIGVAGEEVKLLLQRIVIDVKSYITARDLDQMKVNYPSLNTLFGLLEKELSAEKFLDCSLIFLDHWKTESDFASVAAEKLRQLLQKFKALLIQYEFLDDYSALFCLCNASGSSEKIHYQGEPIEGLQLLSMVETRSLDFNHVFILGANEDLLPGNSFDQSFIPFDLKSFYHLPLPQEKDAMYAYTFYRLIQHPREIHFFYSAVSSDFKGTERSRYITQLENEWGKRNSQISWVKHHVKSPNPISNVQGASNDSFAKSRLDALFQHGISPSAINKFNTCPLDFYYRYIIGLGEEDVLEEQMSSATFGSIVHYVLEKFYEKFKGTFPGIQDYERLEHALPEELTEAIEKEYSVGNVSTGFNSLALTIARQMLNGFIEYEKSLLKDRQQRNIPCTLIDVEMGLRREVDVHKYDWNKPVAMKGKADRLDRIDGTIHILDYKTGSVDNKDVSLGDKIEDVFQNSKSAKKLQLLAYIYMYASTDIPVERINAGFYSFRRPRKGYMFLGNNSETMSRERMDDFESNFMNWVKELYALESFEHNPDAKYCQYCRKNG